MSTAASLQPSDFDAYPRRARELAVASLDCFRALPILFVATLLRQIWKYDWLFQPEQLQIDDQLKLLQDENSRGLREAVVAFDQIPLTQDLLRMRWATEPDKFSEALTAYLWASGHIDAFRSAASAYSATLTELRPKAVRKDPRICIVLLGQGAVAGGSSLFRKLRSKGTLFENVATSDALQTAKELLRGRSERSPEAYEHWWIDGGLAAPHRNQVTISYDELAPVRQRILKVMSRARTSFAGPEGLEGLLHEMDRDDTLETGSNLDPVLRHFAFELFTEGSGTQIYSTTFVQWAAREALRRAQPATMVVHYVPRQSQRPMNDLISVENAPAGVDAEGSLIDADMGSYYTWLNLMRLPTAERDVFIACHEGGRRAIAVSPAMGRGTVSLQPCDLRKIVQWSS